VSFLISCLATKALQKGRELIKRRDPLHPAETLGRGWRLKLLGKAGQGTNQARVYAIKRAGKESCLCAEGGGVEKNKSPVPVNDACAFASSARSNRRVILATLHPLSTSCSIASIEKYATH
jgi:hypothetical protein